MTVYEEMKHTCALLIISSLPSFVVGILLRNERNMKQENLSDYTVDSLLDIIPLFKSSLTVHRP